MEYTVGSKFRQLASATIRQERETVRVHAYQPHFSYYIIGSRSLMIVSGPIVWTRTLEPSTNSPLFRTFCTVVSFNIKGIEGLVRRIENPRGISTLKTYIYRAKVDTHVTRTTGSGGILRYKITSSHPRLVIVLCPFQYIPPNRVAARPESTDFSRVGRGISREQMFLAIVYCALSLSRRPHLVCLVVPHVPAQFPTPHFSIPT